MKEVYFTINGIIYEVAVENTTKLNMLSFDKLSFINIGALALNSRMNKMNLFVCENVYYFALL